MTDTKSKKHKNLTIRFDLAHYKRLRQIMLDRDEPSFQALITSLVDAWAQEAATEPTGGKAQDHPPHAPIARALPRPDQALLSNIGSALEEMPEHKPLRDSLKGVIALSASGHPPGGLSRRRAG